MSLSIPGFVKGFTLATELPYAPCKHHDICGLPAKYDEQYCILHFPRNSKYREFFSRTYMERMEAGCYDFRFVHFPTHVELPKDVCIKGVADFREIVVQGDFQTSGVSFEGGLLISGQVGSILLNGVMIGGKFEVSVSSLHSIGIYRSKIKDGLSLTVSEIANADLRAELSGITKLRGRFQETARFDGGSVDGVLDLADCYFKHQPDFRKTHFSKTAKLILANTRIERNLELIGNSLPSEVVLDGAIVIGPTNIRAEMGSAKPMVVAMEQVPEFSGGASFTNTDLTTCRLAGNDITTMKFANVEWATFHGRRILYDDMALRLGKEIPPGHIKEAYQVLKQWYQARGDQARAGDFHYGEMEMKRREYGWPKRILCPEFMYWAFSGYDIGWVRAFMLLVSLLILFGWGYLRSSGAAFGSDFGNALLFSFQVASFQRPEVPSEFTYWGEWLRITESVLVPVQAALFGFALRNRLKR